MNIYRSVFSLLSILLASSSFLGATPSYQKMTSEALIGANSEAYAVRRIERNNQGSYYNSQEEIFIDEYNKVSGELTKSTLILDRMTQRDAGHSDPNSSPKVTSTIKYQDKALKLADVYKIYAPLSGSWSPDWLEHFSYVENGVMFKNRLLLSSHDITKLFKTSFNHEKAKPKILSIQLHQNSIYFKITTVRSEVGVSSKIICLNPQKTKQLHGWAFIQPIYLEVSAHESLKGANLEALAIHKALRVKDKRSFATTPLEIWSLRQRDNRVVYMIVIKNSGDIIKTQRVEKWGSLLSSNLVPVSSERFVERWTPHQKLIQKK